MIQPKKDNQIEKNCQIKKKSSNQKNHLSKKDCQFKKIHQIKKICQIKKMCPKQLSKNVSKKFVRKCVKNQKNTGHNIRQEHQGTHFCQ